MDACMTPDIMKACSPGGPPPPPPPPPPHEIPPGCVKAIHDTPACFAIPFLPECLEGDMDACMKLPPNPPKACETPEIEAACKHLGEGPPPPPPPGPPELPPPECLKAIKDTPCWDFPGVSECFEKGDMNACMQLPPRPPPVCETPDIEAACSPSPPPAPPSAGTPPIPGSGIIISGFACKNGYGKDLEQKYAYYGKTKDGRPYYRGTKRTWSYIYYDSYCADCCKNMWLLGGEPDVSRESNLNPNDGKGCHNDFSIHTDSMYLPSGLQTVSWKWCGDHGSSGETVSITYEAD